MAEQVQEVVPPTQPEPVPEVQANRSTSKTILLVVLGLIVLVGVAYGIYSLGRQVFPTVSQPKTCTMEVKLCPDGSSVGRTGPNCEFAPCPTRVSSATPTPDETANWKTYTNTKYGYTIKYPVEWNAKVKCEGGITEDDYICLLSPDFEESPAGAVMGSTTKGGLIWIDGRGDLVGSSIDKFCTPSVMTFSDCTEITISNIKGMQRTWANKTTTQVGLVKNNKFVVSLFIVYNDTSRTEILNTFDQILSTFKFLP